MVQFLRILLLSIYQKVTKILYYKMGYFWINFSHFLHPYTNTYILIHYYPVFTKVKTGDYYYFYSKILIIDICQEMLKSSKINFDLSK